MLKRSLRLTSLLAVVMLAACGAEAPALTADITPTASAAPMAEPTPAPTIEATPAPTPEPSPAAAAPRLTGAIVASAYRNGHWDIYTLSTQGDLQKRLTFGEGDNRAPSWSPDGKQIAFESSRDHNWDIYVINADGTGLKRLTNHPRFDGSPRWSPDGQRIAFTSDRDGGLDVWLMDADGANAVNLTPKSRAQNYDPTWSPDGSQIAFTSLRDDNKEIYVTAVGSPCAAAQRAANTASPCGPGQAASGSNARNLTQSKNSDEEHPAWSPDGQRIAFISQRDGAREVFTLDVNAPQTRQRVTALEYHQWPAWSPDGSALLLVAQSDVAQPLEMLVLGQGHATTLTHDHLLYRQPDWNAQTAVTLDEASLKRQDAPLYVEQTTPNPPNRPDRYNLVKLNDVKVIVPLLSDAVDDSFVALRRRIFAESGWDFLARLSEAARPLTFKSNVSDYLSWHKAGRAMDFLFDYFTPQGQMLQVAREDILGETLWRVYLRAAKQDGSQGEPLREVLWDVTEGTRARLRGRGGVPKGVPDGYYVDITEIARQLGWNRIPSHTRPDFDWHRDFQALEYWHYQKTDGLTWWEAIHEIYTPQEIGDLFSYQNLLKAKYDVLAMLEKGIPIPSDVREKYTMLEP